MGLHTPPLLTEFTPPEIFVGFDNPHLSPQKFPKPKHHK